jgi:type I restriction enzyme R subunit
MLFDFFAVCEYFEEEFNYDEVLTLPPEGGNIAAPKGGGSLQPKPTDAEIFSPDPLANLKRIAIPQEGMKIDRMFFQKFEEAIRKDLIIKEAVEAGKWDFVLDYISQKMIEKGKHILCDDSLIANLNISHICQEKLDWRHLDLLFSKTTRDTA